MKVRRWNGQPINEPGIYSGVPIDVYHGADLCDGPSISSSGLRKIFADCPMAYWVESPLNPRRLEAEEKEAFVLGRAAHHLVLGEAEFAKTFVVRPDRYPPAKHDMAENLWWRETKEDQGNAWSSAANWCRAWVQAAEFFGWTVLTPGQIETIRGMAGLLPWQEGLEDSGLLNSAVVRAGALSGLVEHTIVTRDEKTGIWLKSRPDAIPLHSTEFTDFKTTQAVDARSLQRTVDDLRYDMQAVLASICLHGAIGAEFSSFAFVFAMKKAPHAVEIVELTDTDLDEARKDIRVAIDTFAHCLETGRWPGPGGGRGDARFLERSEGSRMRAADRRTFLNSELEAA